MTGIEKRFGPVKALDGIDFIVERGEIHALLGVNGAGKSTLIKILSGIYTADSGTIKIDNEIRSISSPVDAINCGVASVQQHPELVADFTGYENIFLGQEGANRGLFTRVDRGEMRRRANKLLTRLPVDIDLDASIDSLAGVEKEIVAVLHSLKHDNIKILILDEPTSTLTRVEKVQLFKMMRVLKEAGVAIIYITHRLEEVFEIADRFTVFRNGMKIATLSAAEARTADISIPKLMLQEEMGDLFPARVNEVNSPTSIEVRNLSVSGAFENISFDARPGEILGFFGLVGSGIDQLAKTLFGAIKSGTGEIRLGGRTVQFADPNAALQAGIFLVPGDRRTEGLVLTDNVIFNSTLANLTKASWWGGLLRFRRNRKSVSVLAEQIELRPPTLDRAASAFSGGNQQKIVLAKGLFRKADIYIFAEPTVGVDVGARSKLYVLIRELSKTAAVIVMSSDCDEVFGLCDRVSALYRGKMPFEPSRTVTRDELLAGGIMGAAP